MSFVRPPSCFLFPDQICPSSQLQRRGPDQDPGQGRGGRDHHEIDARLGRRPQDQTQCRPQEGKAEGVDVRDGAGDWQRGGAVAQHGLDDKHAHHCPDSHCACAHVSLLRGVHVYEAWHRPEGATIQGDAGMTDSFVRPMIFELCNGAPLGLSSPVAHISTLLWDVFSRYRSPCSSPRLAASCCYHHHHQRIDEEW